MRQYRLWLLLGFLQLTLSACPLTRWLGVDSDSDVSSAVDSSKKDSDFTHIQPPSLDEPLIPLDESENPDHGHSPASTPEEPAPMDLPDPEPAPVDVPEPAPVDVPEPAPVDVPEPAPVDVPEPGPIEITEPAQPEPAQAPEPSTETPPEGVPENAPEPKPSPEEPAVPEVESSETPDHERKPAEIEAPAQVTQRVPFGRFDETESMRMRDYVLSKHEKSMFRGIDPAIDQMLSFDKAPLDLHSIDLVSTGSKKHTSIQKSFDITSTPFCEDFTFDSLGFTDSINSNSARKSRWTDERKSNAVKEMSRINAQFNKVQKAFNAANKEGDIGAMTMAAMANKNQWKVFSSCLAYSESNEHWRKSVPSWRSGSNYGLYQFNPNQKNGGNLNDCVKNWNEHAGQEQVDISEFMKNSALRKSLVIDNSQKFNAFCGVSKLTQTLAQQKWAGEACVNPFKKTYNHFGALTYDVDVNFLRCTSKHFSDVDDTLMVSSDFDETASDSSARLASRDVSGQNRRPASNVDERVMEPAPARDSSGLQVNPHGTERVKPILMPDDAW